MILNTIKDSSGLKSFGTRQLLNDCGFLATIFNQNTDFGLRHYQDDIGKPCAGVNEAQAANIKLSHMFKEKGLDKTCYVVFGSKSYKDKVNEQLKTNPLYLGEFQVKRKNLIVSGLDPPH